MQDIFKNISFVELAIYLGGSIIWLGLINWLHEEEIEAKRKKRFPEMQGRQ